MANSANLPAPYQGVDEDNPKAAIKSPFCENLFNFNTNSNGVSLRKGDSKGFLQALTGGNGFISKLMPYGNDTLFLAVSNAAGGAPLDIYNLSTGALSYTSAALGTTSFNYLYFNKYLFALPLGSYAVTGFSYNGAAWGVSGWTGASLNPVAGNVYKNRAYLIQWNDSSYWYTGINAISGACTKVDLSGVISEKSTLAIITSITLADNVSTEILQAFVFFSGEVLFYSGAYPDSASWGLVGTAKISTVLNYDAGVKYQGDYLVFCDNGVISLRDLFLKGSEGAASLTINANIQKTWQALVSSIRTITSTLIGRILYISGVWDTKNNRIIISFPYYLNTSGVATTGSFYFVFDTIRKAWVFHRSYQAIGGVNEIAVIDIERFNNKNYLLLGSLGTALASAMVSVKEGTTGYTDRNITDNGEVTYDYTMISAPIPFPKTAVYETTGIEPIIQSDLYTETNWTLISDFGKQTTNNQNITDTMGTSITKPLVNVGMQNITYIQVGMNGTTVAGKTVGLDLYSYNVWYNSGETGSR